MTNEFQTNASMQWVQLASEEDWNKLDIIVRGFHDGVIKEMRWSHGEYVNQSYEMVYEDAPSLWVLVQLQLPEIPTVEIQFYGVKELKVETEVELEASFRIELDQITFALSQYQTSRIVAKTCKYRLPGAVMLGPSPYEMQ